MDEVFNKPYNPKEHEQKIYEDWEKSGYFNPDNLPNAEKKEPWTCIMPPPNANGSLHAGHALFVTLQDIMTRFNRMRDKKALWVPGADHAGFETQVVYEKKLSKQGRSRFQMTKEELYKEIWEFTQENKKYMEDQVKKLGASCDWSRKKFTLDEDIINIVYKTFKNLEEDGLLYRGLRSVNWCPKHQTSLSNLEVEYEERTEPFYYFKYGPFVIGTARPETKFADKYIVVHPDDERYKQYKHMQEFEVDWINGKIKATLIKDEVGDPDLGTGAMTITPWHSDIDFELAKKYNLPYEQIIDERGRLMDIAGEFAGMKIKEARPKIVEKLKDMGLLVKIDENYKHSVPVCYKCKTEIEPQLKQQWFIKTKPLAEKAIKAIENGEVKFVTETHKKVALHWLKNIEDWNISRQIAWGIKIPAKICNDCNEGMVDLDNSIKQCRNCGSENIREDEDTFDTWFSSGQWPYAVFGYPNGQDYKTYYPTDVMETAYDILFFWVTRMLMLGIYSTGKVPFKYVYLHGLVRDKHGRKMSKSKGNVINPIEVSDEYGTDAFRMAIVVGNTPGKDLNLDTNKIIAYRKFANKLWNISRFVISKYEENLPDIKEYKNTDETLMNELLDFAHKTTKDMEKFRFHLSSEEIYHFVWHRFADKIIEDSKSILNSENKEEKLKRARTLYEMLKIQLTLLHPYMPFITETIYQKLPEKDNEFLMIRTWPV